MRYLPLFAANFTRHRVRTLLTLGSFAVSLFLFCLLLIVRAAFNQGVEAAGDDRMLVVNKVSLIQPLPYAYRDRIARLPGVAQLTFRAMGRAGQAFVDDGSPPAQTGFEQQPQAGQSEDESEAEAEAGQGR